MNTRRTLAFVLALALADAAAALGADDPRYQIHLITGTLTPSAGVTSEALARLTARPGLAKLHVLVQLHELPTPSAA